MPKLAAVTKTEPAEPPATPGTPTPDATPDDAPRVPKKTARSSGPKVLSARDLAPLDDADDFINALYYGREGSGKSTGLAFLANLGPTVIINAEGGLKKRALRSHGIDTANVFTFPKPGVKITYDQLEQLYQMMYRDLVKDPNSWAGVGMDSITEIATTVLDEVSDARVQAVLRRGDDIDPWWTDRDDYNGMSKRVRRLLRRFRDLPCHFVVTALERRQEDEDTGEVLYGPAVNPGLANDLLGYMDIVLACKAEDDRGPYRAAVRNARRYRVKDRYRVLPDVLANPNILRILDYLDGELTEEVDDDQKLIIKKTPKGKDPEPEAEEKEEDDA